MGCAGSSEVNKVDSQSSSKLARTKAIILLLLGSGEAGKSTLWKHLKIIELNGFQDADRAQYIGLIRANIQQFTLLLAKEAAKDNSVDQETLSRLTTLDEEEQVWQPEGVAIMIRLWSNAAVKQVFAARAERNLVISDGAPHLLDSIERIADANYVPTDADILRVRLRSAGLEKASLNVKGKSFEIWDVGGQMSERLKWEPYLAEATAFVFLAPLSDYDQHMVENPSKLRMQDSLDLLDEILRCSGRGNKPVILIMTKLDIFKEKITRKHITEVFPNYSGPQTWEPASDFILKQFLSRSPKEMYGHVGCMLDTASVKPIWDATRAILLKNALAGAMGGM